MTDARQHADWTVLPLDPGGRSLIEASAGTGKTWTISVLYLRLLLEQRLSPKQIVVTTFTDAAAQELRERIRERLLWAARLADGSAPAALQPTADEAWLRARWSGDAAAARADLHRLRLALAELDLAPIGTLHGLCRRILADFPFECGVPFELGEFVDAAGLRNELLDDLWRCLTQTDTDLSVEDRAAWSLGRKRLAQYLGLLMAPGVSVAPAAAEDVAGFMQARSAARIREWIASTQFTRANSALRSRLVELADFIDAGDADVEAGAKLADGLAKVLDDPLSRHLKPEALASGDHAAILELAREAARCLPAFVVAPLQRALAAYQARLYRQARERLAASGQLTFDELIARVHDALQAPGNVLAARLFEAWPVALVDEFQDTDAQQYGILDRIYRDDGGALRGRLVMIGDPKQAIYRFRGGDIDAYLAARHSATDAMALGVNFRSAHAFVAALNEWHAQAGAVLSTDPSHEIRYVPMRANGRDDAPYTIDGKARETPLCFHYRADAAESQPERRQAALEACANQIVDLLSGGHRIGARGLQPGDIAVLLPSHGDIAELRALLQARDVPCVTSSRNDVFESDWARELRIVLHAALHPRDDAAARAALATRLGGRSWNELRALVADPDAWQRETALFRELDATWRSRGVLAVVRAVIERASTRLFARADRERVLTDLRHLGELLQAQSEALPGRDLLLAWLRDQRKSRGGDGAGEERQLRIESDAARVTLTTLHASKGLEFNVVMLPLMWANVGRSDEIPLLHDHASGRRVVAFDAESAERHAREGQDERFRLLYVALTRARHACHVYALDPARPKQKNAKEAEKDPCRSALDAMVERLRQGGQVQAMPHVLWSEQPWAWPQRRWAAAGSEAEAPREARREPAAAPFEFRYSFSALARHGAQAGAIEEDRPAGDEGVVENALASSDVLPFPTADEAEHAGLAWLAPIAGTEFGNAVHEIFERRRIGVPMAQQPPLIRRALRDAHVRLRERSPDELVPHLAGRLQQVLDTPLLPRRDPALTLGALPAHALRAEMEFDFVLDAVSLRDLRKACDFVPGASVQELRGLMNGKIDLVLEHAGRLHVLDYKTNRLGDGRRLSAYAPERLDAAMDESHYRFQALLYTVAVDRYLRQRVPRYRRGEHLGETIYLFVRAVGIAPDAAPLAGIWAHRFDDRLLDAVDRVFGGRDDARGVA